MALFTQPTPPSGPSTHHGGAAAGNIETTTHAIAALERALSGAAELERIILKAAAGAGKSYALKRMVDEALSNPRCDRVGVTAFANKQVYPLAADLGTALGQDRVCLRVSQKRADEISDDLHACVTVAFSDADVPAEADVIVATTHMFEMVGRRLRERLGNAYNGTHLFDVAFVDEAWQLALHRYRTVEWQAPIIVGVGDVGQLPPLDPSQQPWRGDRGYNPYRAWPTSYEHDAHTWVAELPAVWRPTAEQLPLWRSFYGDWESLTCVAAPGDRSIEIPNGTGPTNEIWQQVGTGVPTLVTVQDLPDPDSPDVDPPLLGTLEGWLDELFAAGFVLHQRTYDESGMPNGELAIPSSDPAGHTLVAVLATRNQAVDDATDMVERLIDKHDLPEGSIVASTVDSWQGQTNAITVAIHPLSGASALDDFNSAFGRLAVTCTRATHGLLMVARDGLDDLLATSPARPGTPLGEPGPRQLPRQTHQRILSTFARGTYSAT
jgi:hypothetical protein